MRTSLAIAEILRREGVDLLFGYPRNPVIEAAAEAGIRTIIVRQERTGLHMADALSRLTRGRRMGVFAMQHGPGTENAYGGVAQAYSESVPVLVLPQGYARRLAHVPDNYNAVRDMRGITKHAEPLTAPAELANVFRRAFTQLRNGRPRPVLVELPWDVLGEEMPGPIEHAPVVRTRSAPDPQAVAAAADALVAAERPVIYAGQGVHWAEAYDELATLAELLAAPVGTSLAGKSAFDETHRLALGAGGAAVPGPLRHFLDRADLILGIGCSFSETAFGVRIPSGQEGHPRDPRPGRPQQVGDLRAGAGRRREADACRAGRGLPRAAARAPRQRPGRGRDRSGRGRMDGRLAAAADLGRGAAQPLSRALGPAADGRRRRRRSSPTTPAARATSSRRSGRR